MGVVPGGVETTKQPPMTIPLRHFVVSLGFLLLGVLAGVWHVAGPSSGFVTAVHVHLLLVGWICVTIMGAMTQFVPVWSGVELYDRRLASVQLGLVVFGLLGFGASLLVGATPVVPLFGLVLLAGFWTFVYNIGRTLSSLEEYDVTERHFAMALGFFLLVTGLGLTLAVDLHTPLFAELQISRPDVIGAHATIAVFGAILTTIIGALYQLGTMFTQTELYGIDRPLQSTEELTFPAGVLLLGTARLLDIGTLARFGGALIVIGLVAAGLILARRLLETQVPWTPMLSRYAVATVAIGLWAIWTLPAWLTAPLGASARFGAPGTAHLLGLGIVGFVVLGTLYHIVPFIIWVHRYSDRLGFEEVPMIDDLYDERLAKIDLTCFASGALLLVTSDWIDGLPLLGLLGGGLVVAGSCLATWNLLSVIRLHSHYSIPALLIPTTLRRDPPDNTG